MGKARGGQTPKLGRVLMKYRKHRTLEQVAIRLRALGFPKTHRGTLHNYERGRPPDISILWGLAQVYRVQFGPLADRMVRELNQKAIDIADEEPLSDEGVEMARVFDRTNSPTLKELLRVATATIREVSGHDVAPSAPSDAPQVLSGGTRARASVLRGRQLETERRALRE